MVPSAPTITGTNISLPLFQIFLISLFESWYFSTFSFFLSLTFVSPGTAMPMMIHSLSFLFTTISLSLPASIKWSHWIFVCFPVHPWGNAHASCLLSPVCFPHRWQCTSLGTLSYFHLYSFVSSSCTHWLCDVQFHLSLHTSHKAETLLTCQYNTYHSLFRELAIVLQKKVALFAFLEQFSNSRSCLLSICWF